MSYRYTAGPNADLFRLADFFEARAVGLGDDFTAEVAVALARIVAHPQAFRPVSPGARGHEVRELKVDRFPVVITYAVVGPEVEILSITHARARRRPWRSRLP